MKYFNAALALLALATGVYDMVTGQWVWAALSIAMAVALAATVDWRDKGAAREVEDVPLPSYEVLRKGFEPVETPTEPPAPLTWADHTKTCEICQERNL